MSVTRVLSLCAASCVAGCTQPAPPRDVQVRVLDEAGRPLASVAVLIDGVSAIRTRLDGVARISLAGDRRTPARIQAACGAGVSTSGSADVPRASSGGTGPDLVALTFTCRPLLHTLAVVARIEGGQGATLRADGETLGTIGADGTLHALLRRPADSVVSLSYATSASAARDEPLRRIRVSDRDEIVLVDHTLARLGSVGDLP